MLDGKGHVQVGKGYVLATVSSCLASSDMGAVGQISRMNVFVILNTTLNAETVSVNSSDGRFEGIKYASGMRRPCDGEVLYAQKSVCLGVCVLEGPCACMKAILSCHDDPPQQTWPARYASHHDGQVGDRTRPHSQVQPHKY